MNVKRITRKAFELSSGLVRASRSNWVKTCKNVFIDTNVDIIDDTHNLVDKVKDVIVEINQEKLV